jgi:hypothetical protein
MNQNDDWATKETKPVRSAKVPTATKDSEEAPQFYKVVLTHPSHNKKVVFRSVSQSRAKAFVENHFPRGSEAHLVTPSGDTLHYERERVGEKGQDVETWQPFNPDDWSAPEESVVPGQDSWADKEG